MANQSKLLHRKFLRHTKTRQSDPADFSFVCAFGRDLMEWPEELILNLQNASPSVKHEFVDWVNTEGMSHVMEVLEHRKADDQKRADDEEDPDGFDTACDIAASILEWPPIRSQQMQNASLSTKREFVDWIKTVVVPDLERRFPVAS